MRKQWVRWASALNPNRVKRDTYALYLAARDPRTPASTKWIIAAVVGYALSPIDLIPDFIPILGYLDDLVLLPVGIWIAIRLMPDHVWEDCKARAAAETANLRPSRCAAAVVVIIWLFLGSACIYWLSTLI